VQILPNPDPRADMLSSVRVGLRAIGSRCDAIVVALADQPSIGSELLGRMVDEFAGGRGRIVLPVHQGQRGHPILFGQEYAAEILAQFDGEGLRGLLRAHPAEIRELPAPDGSVLLDMDRPEDYQRELRRREQR
jgi:molybdenum cofactor cytidylyltransferase